MAKRTDAQATTSDNGFVGGTKQDNNCAGVRGTKSPNKDDVKRAYLATKVINGDTFLNLAWIRIPQNTTSASAHIGFEFNQGTTACTGSAGTAGLVNRVAGDLLIVYDFEGSSTDNPTITLRKWVTSGPCEVGSNSPPCWGPATDLTAAGFAEAKVNTSDVGPVTDTIAPSNETLGNNEFGEAGINLSDALPDVFGPGACNSFGKAEVVSRSSGNSAQAAMEDLVGPVNFSLSNCGKITIIKQTVPRGLNQNFGFTSDIAGTQLSCTTDTTPSSFTLNDNGNTGKTAGSTDPAQNSAGNTETCTNVPVGTYTVTEGANPAGFALTGVSCNTGGTGSVADRKATITIAAGSDVTCLFTNTQQLGAIKILKTSSKASADPLAGATFSITKGGTAIPGSPFTTGADGTICVDNLAFGDYVVTETAAPNGYAIDTTAGQTVTVDNNAKCSDNPYVGESKTFTDTPLTDVLAKTKSQATGGTKSRVTCVDSSNQNIGDSPQPSASTFADPAQVTANGLKPGTYTCTIVIDP